MKQSFGSALIRICLWLLFLLSIVFFAWNLSHGPANIVLSETQIASLKVSLGLRIDGLSSLLFFMVTLLGASVGRYAARYLDGERRQRTFDWYLLLTIGCVSLLVLSSNLLMLFAMWLATSYCLHQLLVYYPERPQAIIAARKKFIVSRIGDVCLLGGIALLYQMTGSFDFDEIFARKNELASTHGSNFHFAGVLFAAGAMTKSAQFPFHFWLPETMETPTPVSALMHAGIINAGGFLIIRMSPLLHLATWALTLLTAVGAITAVFGALVMATQNDIKKKLAYSTISQMGMMMFGCGLGAFSIALFHIFAHSFYKAHAFLSTGNLTAESKKRGLKLQAPSMFILLLASMIGLAIIAIGVNYHSGDYLAYFVYGAVLQLGLFQNIGHADLSSSSRIRVTAITAIGLVLAVIAYAILEHAIGFTVLGIVGPATDGTSSAIIPIAAYLLFVASLFLCAQLMRPGQSAWEKRLYLYFWNGGYFSHWSTRWLASPDLQNRQVHS